MRLAAGGQQVATSFHTPSFQRQNNTHFQQQCDASGILFDTQWRQAILAGFLGMGRALQNVKAESPGSKKAIAESTAC